MFKDNMNLNEQIGIFHTTRLFFLFVLQITAALAVTIFLISFLSYLGYVGELTSAGLFFL